MPVWRKENCRFTISGLALRPSEHGRRPIWWEGLESGRAVLALQEQPGAFFAMILYPSEANSLVSIHLVNKVTQFVNMYLSLIYPSVD